MRGLFLNYDCKAVTTSESERPRRRGFQRGRGRGPRGPKPVNVGDVIEVSIVETSKRGDGIARVRGFVIFVPNTKPGDKVKVKITRIGRTYAVAEVTQEGAATTQQGTESEVEEPEETEGYEEESEE
ncbi:MAG: TRAM domain-containing protein [Vulcanisaeta sp.]